MTEITHKIIIMCVIMVAGFICGKTGLISGNTNKRLSGILLFLISPALTFLSYQREYSGEIAKNLLLALALAVLTHAVMIGASSLIITKRSRDREVEIMSSVFSNCAFMGIPIVQSVFGTDGIIFLTMYITVFHVLTWTYGVTLMTGENTVKDTLRHLVTPTVISVVLGMLFFFFSIPLPWVLREPLQMIGDMNTPLAMLVAGATLSETGFKELIRRPRILYISALRLIVFPVLASLLAALFVKLGAAPMPLTAVVIAAGCPSAVLNVNFALKYNMDGVYASEIFAFSTVACAVTIPLLLQFLTILGVG